MRYKTTRRNSLKGIGAFGLGTYLPFRRSRKTKEIVTAVDGDGPVETATVPVKWWKHRKKAYELKDKLLDEFGGDGVEGGALTRADFDVGSMAGFGIKLYLEDDSVDISIPDSIEGIPIVFEVTEKERRLSCANDGPYTLMKGGIRCSKDSDGVPPATTTGMVKKDGSEYLYTCWHMFDSDPNDNSCDNIVGDTMYHDGSDYGDVYDYSQYEDFALVSTPSTRLEPGVLTSHDGVLHSINGWFNKAGLDTAMSNNRDIYKQGISTGYNQGKISDVGVSKTGPEGCIQLTTADGAEFDIDTAPGDSGGPIFAWDKNDSDAVIMASHVSWGSGSGDSVDVCGGGTTTEATTTYGPIIGEVCDAWNMEFVTS